MANTKTPRFFLVLGGYAIGYEIFEGNIYEGHPLIPVLEKISKKSNLSKPIVVADAGLLSTYNLKQLKINGYKYILGARIKNESTNIKEQILETKLKDGEYKIIVKESGQRIIISHSDKKARKDAHNRKEN